MDYRNPVFDERDAAILAESIAAWDKREGPRVGDWCRMPDGEMLRFTHNWGDGLQTTCRKFKNDTSFYFGRDGYMNFSGSLDPTLPKEQLTDTGEIKQGSAWFFHHGETRAHNGVHVQVPCRVYQYQPKGI